jgi:predicted RNA-binding Zn ribbon-like protein
MPTPCGGHPVLDFVNTYAGWRELRTHGYQPANDYLETYGHLALWVSQAGLLPRAEADALRRRAVPRRNEAVGVLRQAREFRSVLHDALLDPSRRSSVEEVNRHVRRAAAMVSLELPRAAARARWVVDGQLDRPLHAVVWAAAGFLTSVDHAAVHACPGHDCGWMFLSPNGRRKWCDMRSCGNRAKVAAHAARQRAAS